MNILMRSLFNLHRVRESNVEGVRVAVVIDAQTGIVTDEYRRLLKVWKSWISIDTIWIESNLLQPGSLLRQVSTTCQAVVVVSDREDFLEAAWRECASSRLLCVDSRYPSPATPRELALFQEVAHHDFEIGGLNEWDGQPTQFSQYILQYLSRTHCEQLFPKYALPYIEAAQQSRGGRPLEALDIGCGPISVLRWGVLQGLLVVTGVDPLLDMYRIIVERHGYTSLPEIRCHQELCIMAEEISRAVSARSYDFAFTRNAIDHVEDPVLLIQQVSTCLRPGGVMVLDFYTREGTRQKWLQLHQFDLYLDEKERLICQSQDGSTRPLVPKETDLFIREVVVNNADTTIVILEKGEAGLNPEQQRQRATEWRALRDRTRREQTVLYNSSVFAYLRHFRHTLRRWFQ